ncbi:hypothetical protein TNCV_4809211 [Trichonephila clavipes]|nr:hypothetical protein TNCV_4809211 [Trichonephila clavipes]
MSLADELLADLEDAGEVEDEHLYQLDAPVQEVEDIPMEVDNKFQTIRDIAKLRDSEQLQRVMQEIAERRQLDRKDAVGPVEADPEYQLIVEANNLAVEIDNEINIIHKFTRDKYSKRFPELESLVPVPLQYVSTVKELGNDLDKAKNSEILQEFLTPATIMVVSVTASTTQGQLLTEDDLKVIVEACDMAIELDNFKQEIYTYVESRMSFIAPNLSIIVGASTAAKLMDRAESCARLWPSSRQDQGLPTAKSVRVEILFCCNLSLRSHLAFQRGIGRQGGCSVEASLASLSACSFPCMQQ